MTDVAHASLIDELEAADDNFYRPAVPTVFAEYKRFMASGRFPYIDTVVNEITERYDVPGEGKHHPYEGLRKKLSREVYLASGQYRLNQMIAEETRLIGEGWLPITNFEPYEGARLVMPDGLTYRCRAAANKDWCLLPPGKRSQGISLNGLVAQHRAYEEAQTIGQTRMNNPGVKMYRSA